VAEAQVKKPPAPQIPVPRRSQLKAIVVHVSAQERGRHLQAGQALVSASRQEGVVQAIVGEVEHHGRGPGLVEEIGGRGLDVGGVQELVVVPDSQVAVDRAQGLLHAHGQGLFLAHKRDLLATQR